MTSSLQYFIDGMSSQWQRERANAARRKAETARQEADKCEAALDAALGEVTRLESLLDEASNAQIQAPAPRSRGGRVESVVGRPLPEDEA